MNLLLLFFEFMRVGLFAVGGGLATVPFLSELGARSGWFTAIELSDMIAVSESTPGPIGIKMAAYVGFRFIGIPGAVTAVLGLTTPTVVINLIIARFLTRFKESRGIEATFYGLRPASVALIGAVWIQLMLSAVTFGAWSAPNWPALCLFAVLFLLLACTPVKKLHPAVLIAAAAVTGIVLKL